MGHTEKIITVFQHDSCGGMGYLGTFLDDRHIPYNVIHIDKGESLPSSIENSAGLIFLGSNRSVNDRHSWIANEISLIKRAAETDLPVLGICFGGQLISKALGGIVEEAPDSRKQIGWFRIDTTPEAISIINSKLPISFDAFEWHEEVFSVPTHGIPLFYGECIKQQGFLHGQCLALQFHLEITQNKIEHCLVQAGNSQNNCSEYGCDTERMLQNLDERVERLHAVADIVFGWWLNRKKH